MPLLQGRFQQSALNSHGDSLLGGRQGCLVLAPQREKCYHDGSAAVLMVKAPDWSYFFINPGKADVRTLLCQQQHSSILLSAALLYS